MTKLMDCLFCPCLVISLSYTRNIAALIISLTLCLLLVTILRLWHKYKRYKTVISTATRQECHSLSSRPWNYLLYHFPVDNCFCFGFFYICRMAGTLLGQTWFECNSSGGFTFFIILRSLSPLWYAILIWGS